MDQTESTQPGNADSEAATAVGVAAPSEQVKFMDVASTVRLNKWKFLVLVVAVIAGLNVVSMAREPDVPLYKTKALVLASELAIRVDAFPRTAVAIFNGGTVARLAANYAGTGISPDDLIPAVVDITPVENTGVVEIDAIHPDPELAAVYANAAGRALAEELNRVGPGLGSFALQIEAPVPVIPLEVSRLPTVVFSVVAALLLAAGLAALVAFVQSSGRKVPLFAGPLRVPRMKKPVQETSEPTADIIGTVKMGGQVSQPAIAANERREPTAVEPRRSEVPAIERSLTPPPPPRAEPQERLGASTSDHLDPFQPLITPLEKIAQPSPLHPLLFVDEEAAHVLEEIEGVDAVFAARLVAAGITSLDEMGSADGKWLSDAIEVRRDIVVDWISQAGRMSQVSDTADEGFGAVSDDISTPDVEQEPGLGEGRPSSDQASYVQSSGRPSEKTGLPDDGSGARGVPPMAPEGKTNGYRKPPPSKPSSTANSDEDLTLRSIRGIGAVFAERLISVGITTVEDLADANASSLAYTMEVRYGTVADWIKQARALGTSPDVGSEAR